MRISMRGKNYTGALHDQRGLVSFMITLIMMLVISLIVVGFTQVTNRNRREALDRSLSTQAFYAAESGVNDALSVIESKLASSSPLPKQDTCSSAAYSLNPDLKSDGSVKYTCVLINPIPPNIQTHVTQQGSMVFPLNPVDADGNPVVPKTLTFTWSMKDGGAIAKTCGSYGVFSAVAPCDFGILRVDLMQYDGATFASDAAGSRTATFFLQPVNGGAGSTDVTSLAAPEGVVVSAACKTPSNPQECTATLNMNTAAVRSSQYYVRLTMIYNDAETVTIDGVDTTNKSLNFQGAQVTIDSTGKAQDVLRRIKVRKSLTDYTASNAIPLGALDSSAAICKQFTTYDGYYQGCP
jgi:hypothetical protein